MGSLVSREFTRARARGLLRRNGRPALFVQAIKPKTHGNHLFPDVPPSSPPGRLLDFRCALGARCLCCPASPGLQGPYVRAAQPPVCV